MIHNFEIPKRSLTFHADSTYNWVILRIPIYKGPIVIGLPIANLYRPIAIGPL